jgi:hypothetical protein
MVPVRIQAGATAPAPAATARAVYATTAHSIEVVEVGERRCGCARRGARAVAAQQVERGAQLLERIAAGRLDVRQRGPGLVGLLVEQMQRDARLHVDQRDVVREHVVQLLREREALLALRPLALLGEPLAPSPHDLRDGEDADEPPDDQREVTERRQAPVAVRVERVGRDEPEERQRRQRPRLAPATGLDRDEQRDHHTQEHGAVRVATRDVDVGGGDAHRYGDERVPVTPRECGRAGEHEDDGERVDRASPRFRLVVRSTERADDLERREPERRQPHTRRASSPPCPRRYACPCEPASSPGRSRAYARGRTVRV